jgi:hypothetical protein
LLERDLQGRKLNADDFGLFRCHLVFRHLPSARC